MTTYICKCGRTFQKSTHAATTAHKMPDYGPEHECYGCPFVQSEKWKDPISGEISGIFACRGSQKIGYQTIAHTCESKGATFHVNTLDLKFINEVFQFYLTLDGHAYDHLYHGMDDEEGTWPYSFHFESNKKGEAAKRTLIDKFFQTGGNAWEFTNRSGYFTRKDVTPEQEKEIVLNQIKGAKAMAHERTDMERPEDDPGDIGPDGMEELAEDQEPVRSDSGSANDPPKSDGNEADSANDADETPDFEANSDDSADDETEAPPQVCDWQNASGDDEKEPEDEESDEVSGDPLSLRGPEFDYIINPANTALNRFVAMLHAKKQHDGEINIKVTFEDNGGSYIFGGAVSGKINLTMKPQKVTGDAVELQFDAQGNPIVPADREHQLSFDEIQPGQRKYPPQGGTATVDGKTGIVEHYEGEEDEPADPPTSDNVTDSAAADELEGGGPDPAPDTASDETDEPYPCKNVDCPFYGASDSGDPGCCYKAGEEPDPFDADSAVEQENCTRPEILQAYADGHPDESEENIELDEKKG